MISDDVTVKYTLLSASYMVILFTVFVQGCTIKPLVRYLNIRLARKTDNFYMFLEFNRGVIQHMSAGIEEICGYKDISWVSRSSAFSKKYVRPILEKNYKECRKRGEGKLLEMDRAATMREALRTSASTSSFKRQQTFDEMAENGDLPRDLMDEEDLLPYRTHEDVEQKTIELTKDITHIRQLWQNPLSQVHNHFKSDKIATKP